MQKFLLLPLSRLDFFLAIFEMPVFFCKSTDIFLTCSARVVLIEDYMHWGQNSLEMCSGLLESFLSLQIKPKNMPWIVFLCLYVKMCVFLIRKFIQLIFTRFWN